MYFSQWLKAGSFGLVLVGLSACGGPPAHDPGASAGSSPEFDRCMAQQKYGCASTCWKAFVERFGASASASEKAYAEEHVNCTPGTAAPVASGETRALSADASAASGSYPAQQVAFDQCYKGIHLSGDSQRDVEELGRRCGGPCGMIPFSQVLSDQQDEADNVDAYNVDLQASHCYRFFAAGDQGIQDLDSAIADEQGKILMHDVFQDPAPILGPEGPFCPPADGHYKFIVSVAKGRGVYRFQVWQGPRR